MSAVKPNLTLVVYHLPKNSENFGWNVNGKINFVSPNGNFLGKTGFLEGRPKFPNGIFKWKMCVPIASILLVPGFLAWIAFNPIFREKVVEMERTHPTENFHLGFDAYHLLQLSNNRFFRVNGKQPLSLWQSLTTKIILWTNQNTSS